MKKLFYFALILVLSITACTKSSDVHPIVTNNSVTISGTDYSTLVLGSQTWTTVNYNGPGGENYSNGANNPSFGKLYSQDEAMAIVLPTGWRLPTVADYFNLVALTGAVKQNDGLYTVTDDERHKLMSATGWNVDNGSNSLGFNVLPAGFYNGGSFAERGTMAQFITSDSSGGSPLTFTFAGGEVNVSEMFFSASTEGGSIRFVKNN